MNTYNHLGAHCKGTWLYKYLIVEQVLIKQQVKQAYNAPNVLSPLYVMYKKPSASLCLSYTCDIKAPINTLTKERVIIRPVGGSTLFTNKNIELSGLSSFMCFLISKTNFPTVISDGTKYFFLSISGALAFGAFSTITYIKQTSELFSYTNLPVYDRHTLHEFSQPLLFSFL